ncbi:MAG: substrate-binding domain-containing protein, partial [Planctomycetota bacterium]|nr:substrate-binding domain-containing protein [Planctomycetota bacterium]
MAIAAGIGLAVAVGAAKAGEKQTLSIKGSDTMVHLASQWAEEYMKKNPKAEISVTGGGSGTGIAALLNGTTDIANSSRNIEEKEKKIAAEKKLDIKEHLVALDGICVVVNPACPLNEITIEQLEKIFTGKATNWKEVGGNDAEIVALSRESTSGTYI